MDDLASNFVETFPFVHLVLPERLPTYSLTDAGPCVNYVLPRPSNPDSDIFFSINFLVSEQLGNEF